MAGLNNVSDSTPLGPRPPPPDLLFPHLWSPNFDKSNKPWSGDTANWSLLSNLASLLPTNPEYYTSITSKLPSPAALTNRPAINETNVTNLESLNKISGKRPISSTFVSNFSPQEARREQTRCVTSVTRTASLTPSITKSDPDLDGIPLAKQRKPKNVDDQPFCLGNPTQNFTPTWIDRWTGLCNYSNFEYLKSTDLNSMKSFGMNKSKADPTVIGLLDDEDNDQQQDDEDYEPEEPELNDSETNSRSGQNTECVVCGDKSSGKHYGQHTCEGCKSFFKRSVRRKLTYTCRGNRQCPIDIHHRNQCQYCRFQKCIKVGMRKEAVQQGRLPPFSVIYHPFFGPSSYMTTHPAYSQHPSCTQIISLLLNAEQISYKFQTNIIRPNAKSIATESSPSVSTGQTSTTHMITNLATSKHKEQISNSSSPDRGSPSTQIHDYAMSTLISIIEWARNIPLFTDLQLQDQLSLLQNTWSELFLLTTAQTFQHRMLTDLFDPETRLNSNDSNKLTNRVQNASPDSVNSSNRGSHGPNNNSTKSVNQPKDLSHYWNTVQDQLERLKLLQMDAAEFACLKAIVLFNSEISGLSDPINVECVQEKIQSALEEYEKFQYLHYEPFRFGRVLLRLPRLCQIPALWLVKIFFPNSECTNSIHSLIKENLLHGPPPNASAWSIYGWNTLSETPQTVPQAEQLKFNRSYAMDFPNNSYKSWENLGFSNFTSLNSELPYTASFLRAPYSKDSQFQIPSVAKPFVSSYGRDTYSFVPSYPDEKGNLTEQLYRPDVFFPPPPPPPPPLPLPLSTPPQRFGRPGDMSQSNELHLLPNIRHNQCMNVRYPDFINNSSSSCNDSNPTLRCSQSNSPDLCKLKQPPATHLVTDPKLSLTTPITETLKWNHLNSINVGTNPDWQVYYTLLRHQLNLFQKQANVNSKIPNSSRTDGSKLPNESRMSSD